MLIHTEWRGVVLGENLIFGTVRVEKQKVVQVTDAVSQGANGKVFGSIRQQIPDQPLTLPNNNQAVQKVSYQDSLILCMNELNNFAHAQINKL